MQADVENDVTTGQPKKRTFKKFSFRGVDLDALLDMSTDELVKLFHARARRRYFFFMLYVYFFCTVVSFVIFFSKLVSYSEGRILSYKVQH